MADVETAKGNATAGVCPVQTAEWDWNRILTPHVVLLMLPVVLLTLWAYWYPLWRWETIWRGSAAWNHGYLIPLIAILIAHFRLKELNPTRIEPSLWGLSIIFSGLVIRIWSQTLKYGYPGEATFLIVAAGVAILLLGWPMFKVLWIPVFYLGLMIPWDAKYYDSVALPLQTMSAAAAEKFLPLVGLTVDRHVNVLNLASGPLTIAEACSGLHLLFAFVALGIMMAFTYRRPLWERLAIIGSSVPIAVFCNFVRVTLMAISSDGLFFEAGRAAKGAATWANWIPGFIWNMFPGTDLVERLVKFRENVLNPESYLHQSFGFAMLALAFVLMWAELRLIDMLFVEEEEGEDCGSRIANCGLKTNNNSPGAAPLIHNPQSAIRNPQFLFLGAALAASLVMAVVRVVMGGPADVVILAALAIAAAAVGLGLLALAFTGRMPADWAIIAVVAPLTYLVLGTAPRSASLEAWPVAQLILALACAGGYLWLALPMGRRIQYRVCCATMGVAAVFFTLWEPPPPKPVPIAKHLALLEAEVLRAMPGWTGKSQRLSPEVEKVLGADEYLSLELTAPAGDYRVLVFITYNANAMSQVPHVPWVCMTQAGYRLVSRRQDGLPIMAIPGKEIQPNVMMFEGGEGRQASKALMIQYFNVGGTYAWDRQVARFLATSGSLGQKGSFLSQTQVAVWVAAATNEDPSAKTSRAYHIAADFVNVLVPLLEREYYPNLGGAEPASPK